MTSERRGMEGTAPGLVTEIAAAMEASRMACAMGMPAA